MGVRGLWNIVSAVAEETSLDDFAVTGHRNSGPSRRFTVGIDASIWFYQAAHPFRHSYISSGSQPALRTLFYRLARLAQLPIIPLFVFDGPERPDYKRNHRIKAFEIWIADDLRQFVVAFGFSFHIAPGEAEAELALLNKAGYLDAVYTNDSDVLVFGALNVLRRGNHEDGEDAKLYRAMEIHEALNLSEGGLFLMPILRGGDYDMIGLKGCGENIAYQLAQTGLGDRLLRAVRGMTPNALSGFLVDWRIELQRELQTNESQCLSRCHPTIAQEVSDTFPELKILQFYSNPLTSALPLDTDHVVCNLNYATMDVSRLASLCDNYFNWGETAVLAEKFRKVIWPGVVTQLMLLNKSTAAENVAKLTALELLPLNRSNYVTQPPLTIRTLVINTTSLNKDIKMRAPTFRQRKYGSRLYKKPPSRRTQSTACRVRVLQYVYDTFTTEFCDDDEGSEGDVNIDAEELQALEVVSVATTVSSGQAGPSCNNRPAQRFPEVIEISSGSEMGSIIVDLYDN